jgi:hypothetical protein
MPASIDRFLSAFKSRDFSTPKRFEAKIYFPQNDRFQIDPASGYEVITLRCETAELPARTLATTEQKVYGPVEKFPYLTTYNDLDLTFILDGDMTQKKIFDDWLSLVNPQESYDFSYKEDYIGEIQISQYDQQDTETYKVLFNEIYPISVGQLALDWSAEGYHKLTVTFAYTSWIPMN